MDVISFYLGGENTMLRHVLDVLSCGIGSAVSLGSLRSPIDCNSRLRCWSVGSELIDCTFTGYSLCTCSRINFSPLPSSLMCAQSLSNFTSTGFILSRRMRNTSSDRKNSALVAQALATQYKCGSGGLHYGRKMLLLRLRGTQALYRVKAQLNEDLE